MSQETESTIAYNSLLKKLFELSNMQDECRYLVDQAFDFREMVAIKFAAVRNMPYEIEQEMDVMMENKDLLLFDEELSNSTYDSTKKAYDTKIQEHSMYLQTQKAEAALKHEELDNFGKELNVLKEGLDQKRLSISAFHDKMSEETSLVEEQRACFQELTSTAEIKVKNSKFVRMQNELQTESSELNAIIDTKKESNINIRKENSTISEELGGVEAQCRYKAIDVDKLLCKDNFNEATYRRAETKNHKINRKIETTLQKQENEIVELEMHIAKQQEINDSLTKKYNELTDLINSDLGNFASLEDKLLQSEIDLAKFNDECNTLDNVLNEENKFKIENEEKLKKFLERIAKLKEAERRMEEENEKQSQKHQLSQNQVFQNQMSQNQDLKPPERLKMGGLTEGLRSDEREHVFSLPVTTPRKVQTSRKLKKKRQSPRAIDQTIVQSADSSVSDMWNISIAEVDDQCEQRHQHTLELMRQFMG